MNAPTSRTRRHLALGATLLLAVAYLVQIAPHGHPDAHENTDGHAHSHHDHPHHDEHAGATHAHADTGAREAQETTRHHHHPLAQHLDDHAVRDGHGVDVPDDEASASTIPYASGSTG